MFDNIKKLFSYNWSGDFFNQLKPTENEILVSDTVKRDIKQGALFLYVYMIINCIASIVLAVRVNDHLGVLGKYLDYNDYKQEAIVSAIVSAVVSAVILYFITKYLTGDQKRKPLWYFVITVLTLIGVVLLTLSFIGLFAIAVFDVLYCLLVVLGVAVSLVGYSHILVGCIDFCLEANKTASKVEGQNKM